jgi:hypothetical protein
VSCWNSEREEFVVTNERENRQDTGHFNVDAFPVIIPPPEIHREAEPAKEHEEALVGKAAVLPSQRHEEALAGKAAVLLSQSMGEVIAFCTLALLGGALLFLVALTDMLWVYPATFYGVLIYVAWVRYFSH